MIADLNSGGKVRCHMDTVEKRGHSPQAFPNPALRKEREGRAPTVLLMPARSKAGPPRHLRTLRRGKCPTRFTWESQSRRGFLPAGRFCSPLFRVAHIDRSRCSLVHFSNFALYFSLGCLLGVLVSVEAIMLQDKVKHLELIQSVITRMAGNSALLKGWSVTLSAALIGLAAAKDARPQYALLGCFPPVFFAILDAFYLRQERLFRRLYDRVRLMNDADWEKDPFSMDTRVIPDVDGWARTVFSKVVFLPHFLVVLTVLGVVMIWCFGLPKLCST